VAGEDVSVKIGGDATGAKEAVSSVAKALEGFKGAMQGIAGALAFEKITSGFHSILAESSKAEQESRRFINTMQGVGTAADPAKFFALADSLEKMTTFEAEESLAAGYMLARFRLTQAQMQSMLPLVQDLAAYMGKDLAGAADEVGKAVELGAVGLRGLNLGFDKAAKSAFDMAEKDERVAMIMARMQQQVGGFAQVVASTAVGSIKQFQIAIGNVAEALGGVIDAPIAASMQSLTGYVRDATTWFSGLSDGTKNVLGAMATGVAVMGGFATGLLSIAGAASAVVKFWPAFANGLAAIQTAGATAFSTILVPLSAVVAGMVGAILVVGALRNAWVGDLGGMRSFVVGWVRDVKYIWAELVGFVRDAWGSFADWFSEKFIVMRGLMQGLSAEQVGAQLQDAKKTDPTQNLTGNIESAFAAAQSMVQDGLNTGSAALASVWDDAKGVFADGIAGLKDVAAMLGINLESFSQHTQKQFAPTGGVQGGGGGVGRGGGVFSGLDFAADMGDVAASVATMASLASISEGDFQKILDSVNGDADKAMQVAVQFAGMAGTINQAAANIEGYWETAAGQMQLVLANISAGFEQFGQRLLNNLGPLGGIVKNAMSAAATTGNPFAAIGSVLADMLAQSQSFQVMLQLVTDSLSQMAQAINPLIDAFKPIIDVTLSLTQQIVSSILDPLLGQVAPLIQMVATAVAQIFAALGPVLSSLNGVLQSVMTAVMPIVMMVMPIVQMIADVLSDLAPVLNLMLVPLQLWASIMIAAKPIFDLFFTGIKYLMAGVMMVAKGIAWVYNGILEGVATLVGFIPGLGDVSKRIRSAQINLSKFDLQSDALASSTNNATKSLDTFATSSNKAAQAAEALSNVPSILKVTRLRLESALADGVPSFNNASASAAARQATGVALSAVQNSNQTRNDVNNRQVFIDSLTVNGKPADVWDPIKRAMEAERYRLSGSTEASPYPNATPRVVGAH
jgi:hypothetical protein